MKHCSRCRKPFTEFDINFSRFVFPDRNICCSCSFNKEQRLELKRLEKGDENLKLHIRPLIFTLILAVSVLVCLIFDDTDFSEMAAPVVGTAMFVLIAYWLYCGINVVKSTFKVRPSETTYGRTHTEIKQTSSNSYTVEKVTDTYSEGGWKFGYVLLVITYPLWCLFHLLYILSVGKNSHLNKASKIIPIEVINAYEYARKETEKVKVVMSPKEFMGFKKQKDKYRESINQTNNKYSMLGAEAVKRALRNIKIPTISATINGEPHTVVDIFYYHNYYYHNYSTSGQPDYLMFLLRKNQNGDVEGTVINSEMYKSPYSLNWEKDWSETHYIEKDLLEKIKEFAKTL